MVRSAAFYAHSASGKTVHDYVVGDGNLKSLVNPYAALLKSFSLRNGAGEAVKDETVFAVILGETLLDDGDNKSIRNEFSGLHVFFSFKSQFSLVFNGLTKDVSRADGGDSELFFKNFSLSSFASAGSTEKNKIHGLYLLNYSRNPL